MNKKNIILNKILNSFVGILLVFQSFAPGILYAQEASPTVAVEPTPSPSVELTPSPTQEPSVTPSPESTPTLQPSPSVEPTASPEVSPSPSVLPEASPQILPSPDPSSQPSPTDQVESNSSPEPTVGQPNAPPDESPTPQTPEPSPSVSAQQPAEGHLSATILENTDAESLELDLSTQSDISSASLSTDKADYAPTDTAVISGADFPKNADLKLIITADNYRFETEVKTDDKGTFIYMYQLDGTYRPLYNVEAQDLSGQILATTSFTDTNTACTPPPSGMTSWWPGDGDADDIAGTNNGTLENGATFASGKVDQAFSFDGTNDWVAASNVGDFGSNPFTVDFWMKSNNDGGSDPTFILGKNHANGGLGWDIRLSNSTIRVVGVNGWGFNITSDASATPNVWHHIALASTDTTVNLYIDGILKGTSPRSAITSTSNPFRIGFTTDFGSPAFNGLIDKVEIFNRALSLSEIQDIYNADSAGKCKTESGPDPSPSPSPSPDWPSSWTSPSQCTTDPANDENPSQIDLIGDGSNPAIGFSSDANYFYFRERVGGDPSGPGSFSQNAWVVLFQTSSPQYQYLGSLNGKDDLVQLWSNTVNAPDNGGVDFSPLFNDPADSVVWQGAVANYARIVNAGGGVYFADWAIPASEITSRGVTNSTTKFFATSADANNYNKDHLNCYEAIADLSVTKADSQDPVNAGASLTYTITATNNGPDPAGNVIVVDSLPTEIVALSLVSSSQGSCSDITLPSPIQCELGTLASGASATITVTGTVSGSASGTITNTVSVNSDTLDTNTSNNSDSEDTNIRQQQTQLTLTKTVINNSGGTKQVADFQLKIDGNNVTSGVANVVSAGAHTASEVGQTGYTASSWGGDCNTDGTITLALGDNKTCTITNDDTPAHLIVIKNVVNGNGGNAAPSDFTMTINDVDAEGNESFPGQAAPGTDKILVSVGSYSVTESGPAGYDDSYSSDCNGSVALGETKTCTITNNDIAPTITLIKEVTNDNGGNAGPNDFGISIGGQNVTSGDPQDVAANTPLAINETGISGYSFVSITGDAKCPSSLGGTVTLDEGEDVTCTITNNDDVPSLTLVKRVVTDNNGTAQPSDWTLTASGPTGFSGQGPSVSSDASFKAGTYNLSESGGPSGYSASAWICTGGTQVDGDTITVALGQTVTCTITNDDEAGTLIVRKIVRNDNGGILNEEDFSFKVNNGSAVPFETDGQNDLTVDAGTYTITEPSVDSYDTTYDNCSNVVISNGGTQECTITNDDQPAHLIVIKHVENNDGGTALASDFTMTINGLVVQSGGSSFSGEEAPGIDRIVEPGTYEVTENGPDGYQSNFSADCSGSIALGETKTCTVTNDDEAATLIVRKIVENNNGGNLEAQDFSFQVNDGIETPFEADGENEQTVEAGTYTITEPSVDGYDTSYDNCSGVVIANGDTQVCTITNDDQPGSISGIKWHDKDGNGEQDCEDDSEEFCELGLEGWTIFLDENGDGLFDEGEDFEETDEDGFYSLADLNAGTYRVCEEMKNDWSQTFPDNGELNNCHEVTVSSGEDVEGVDFGNRGQGTITVHKNVDNDGDEEVDEENVTDWTWDIDGQGDFATGDTAQTVAAGSYTVSEDQQDGFHVTAVECKDGQIYDASERIEVSLEAGQDLVCTFTNTRDRGSITIIKNIDANGDEDTLDEGDVRNAQGWTYDIAEGDQDNPMGGSKTLAPGTYTISEDQKAGHQLFGWSCSNEQTGTTNSIEINVTNGSDTTCTFTNQSLPPVLSLTKTNDKTGIDVSAGANVLYTLTVTLTGSPLANVSLTDLPPAGFKYRPGSWTAVSSLRGDLKPEVTTEPTYASPGTWNLGDMTSGEVVTLTYIADIDGSTDPGLYKDLAWSKGTGSGSTVLANEESGFFVGTEVNVVKDQGESTGVNVERIEEKEGEVLGASIELPATGANAVWLLFATFLLLSGAGLVWKGISLRRKI